MLCQPSGIRTDRIFEPMARPNASRQRDCCSCSSAARPACLSTRWWPVSALFTCSRIGRESSSNRYLDPGGPRCSKPYLHPADNTKPASRARTGRRVGGLIFAAHEAAASSRLQSGAAAIAGGTCSTRAALLRSPSHERLGLHSSPSVLPPISELQVDQCRPVRQFLSAQACAGHTDIIPLQAASSVRSLTQPCPATSFRSAARQPGWDRFAG